MSLERKRTETVYEIVRELVDSGRTVFRPGDVCSALRQRNQPMGAWQVRGEFHLLEQRALIKPNPETGDWQLTENVPTNADFAPLANAGLSAAVTYPFEYGNARSAIGRQLMRCHRRRGTQLNF